jgi:hypothetical protein
MESGDRGRPNVGKENKHLVTSDEGTSYCAQCEMYARKIEELQKKIEGLVDYCVHDSRCILSRSCAGEPTPDGGYRTKYGDRWYQTRPVNKTPKCKCGLDDLLAKGE